MCALLTPHGRQRTLTFKVDFDRYGSIPADSPRLPQTCAQVISREWQEVHRANQSLATRGAISWPGDLRRSTLSVVSVGGGRAKVKVRADRNGAELLFWLRRTASGWRIDDSDGVPSGH